MATEPQPDSESGRRENGVPLTAAQSEIWFACQMSAGASLAYNESMTLRLKGGLSLGALRRALRLLVARHEALRTRISATGDRQRVQPVGDIELTIDEIPPAVSDADRETQATEWLDAKVGQPFELAEGPLFRAALLRIEGDTHFLALIVHHVICDGWSLGVLVRELSVLYAAECLGRAAKLPAAPTLSAFLKQESSGNPPPEFGAARDFWHREFAAAPPELELPTDRPRQGERTYRGALRTRLLPADVTAEVKKLGTTHNCTAFTALLAAFAVLVHRLTGQEDIVVGVPSATQVMAGFGALVGNFANLLPFRSHAPDNPPFADYLARVRQQLSAALEHWRYPFGSLLQFLNLPRDLNRVPLAPILFNTTGRHGALEFGGLAATVEVAPKHFVNFDLNFHFGVSDEQMTLGCYYSTELFDETTITRWFDHFETLLRGIAATPNARVSELPLLTTSERRQILHEWNQTALDYRRDATIPELFAGQVQRSPEAVALVAGEERVTYAELDRRAEKLAAQLRAGGVGPEVLVGVLLERTPHLLVALLAVLKAGGAYVPLNPAYPTQRLDFIIGDTKMPVIVTQRSLTSHLPPTKMGVVVIDEILSGDATNSPSSALGTTRSTSSGLTSSSLAYVIYTSGSTGQPKGVCLEHRGVVALAAWAKQHYTPEELAGVLFATSATFDVSVFESLVPLCLGGKIILADNILALPTLPAVGEVRLISGVPSAVAELVRSHKLPASVRTVNVAGEPCPQALVEALYALGHVKRVVDVYGPTETTVYSTGSVRTAGGRATIGRPLSNERAYVLDRRQQPAPIGVRGELCIGGEKLARGYLNRDDLTREKFVDVPFLPGERVYRTGDEARFLADGSIEFLGRLDHQVKIRGHRIELGEIEMTLLQDPAVAEAVVVAVAEPHGSGQRLAAYVVLDAGAAKRATAPDLRDHLQTQLPDYMVPAAFVLLDTLPRTSSGKVDRRALPAPDFSAGAAAVRVAPRNTTEQLLAEIWLEVLGLKQIGVHDNFFELGGHSLLAAQVIARINDSLGVELTMRQFFVAPTVAGMAPAIETALIDDIQASTDADTTSARKLATAKE